MTFSSRSSPNLNYSLSGVLSKYESNLSITNQAMSIIAKFNHLTLKAKVIKKTMSHLNMSTYWFLSFVLLFCQVFRVTSNNVNNVIYLNDDKQLLKYTQSMFWRAEKWKSFKHNRGSHRENVLRLHVHKIVTVFQP